MKRALFAACGLMGLIALPAFARGVSPYLPLNIDPYIERQIERVLILADKPVLTRPIVASTVLDALPVACRSEPELCQEVRRYLARYMRAWGLTEASIEASTSSGSQTTLPNRHGLTTSSDWEAIARAYWQPSDYALVNLGAVAYQGEVVPSGSYLSLGFDWAQLDLGYREHWLSPFTDSSMLIGTQAATMPSVTLSNNVPLTRFGFRYAAFAARMSESDRIAFGSGTVSGRPRIAGVHVSMEPASGWALGFNRLLQYGGGPRPSGTGDLIRAFFKPFQYDNELGRDEQFGNQLASINSSFLFPGRVPFSIYLEYAGEDTLNGNNFLLGNQAFSAGIRFPRLWRRFDVTYEASEWVNAWYVNGVYGDGLTNKGRVIGHWGGDMRQFNDGVGAQSHTLRVGWQAPTGGLLELRLSTLANESYSSVPYERAYDGTLRYSRPVGAFTVGAEVFSGRDVFGESFSRVGAFFRYSPDRGMGSSFFDPDPEGSVDKTAELFVEAGMNASVIRFDLDAISTSSKNVTGPHFALGARRAVSDRSDLGARIELDEVDGHTLLSVRALDYRYRFSNPLALGVFVGAARYDLGTPAYGLYYGTGLQWRDIRPGWDAGLEARFHMRLARDHLLPEDPQTARPDSYYHVTSLGFVVTRRF